ncbi:unnamed protein product [Orchesella dallaii]|uniref:Uncharacterized protein n=1 Tax=Orchesella dallaii TaxID=48710 RepID=A0ABP1S2F2_9HEXA
MRIMFYAYVLSGTEYALDISDVKLERLQRMLDNVLYEFEYPSLMRSKKRKFLDVIDLERIRERYGVLAIKQGRDYIIMKDMCNKFMRNELNLSNRQYARCTPLVKLRNFNSEMYKNSPDHRGANMWNEIPRDVDIQKLGVAQFLEQFKQGKYAKKSKIFTLTTVN